MLTHFYAHNFRCLENFELKLDKLNLLMGPNGSGKSSVLDVLRRLQSFIAGDLRVHQAFPSHERTRGSGTPVQDFQMTISLDDESLGSPLLHYHLVVEHDADGRQCHVKKEILTDTGSPLFEFVDGEVHLYNDQHEAGPVYPFDPTMSGLAAVHGRNDNRLLTAFKASVAKFVIVAFSPAEMESESRNEALKPDRRMKNFVSWYRRLSQEHMGATFDLFKELRIALPGFHSFSFKDVAEGTKALKVLFDQSDNGRKQLSFDFDELSDGQRVLIVLYTLVHGLRGENLTLFLDEPDNYVALREIQPWLGALSDECGEGFEQAVLISHHPEIINYMGSTQGKWFSREGTGPSRVSDNAPTATEGLTLAETIARGWEEP
ncbi:MAG: AAA family ATPase [Verrucomicrobia bacterium]|nr:AAA family ATPase [Verrucomicrobiota bacterium]